MHENRETPSPTVSESGSPAGEGESRTSGMHSSGESDGAVVPMKPSNKATGQAPEAAERVEGRASTKENVQQARAVPAQHGAAASQGLKGVRKVAKERKQERFTTLLHPLTVNLLRDSYYALKREAAPGVDGVRWAEYEDGLEPRLKDLHERVHRGSYRAQASRRIYMQKPDGRQRPIGIAALEDKIVQQAVVTPRTQRITSNLSVGWSFDGNRVHIDPCLIRLYVYDRCHAPARLSKPSASIARATCCGVSISSPMRSNNWPMPAPYRPAKPIGTSNKLSG